MQLQTIKYNLNSCQTECDLDCQKYLLLKLKSNLTTLMLWKEQQRLNLFSSIKNTEDWEMCSILLFILYVPWSGMWFSIETYHLDIFPSQGKYGRCQSAILEYYKPSLIHSFWLEIKLSRQLDV